MKFFSRDIFDQIVQRKEGWKDNLPEGVAKMIESKNLWSEVRNKFIHYISKFYEMYLTNRKRVLKVFGN